MSLWEYSVKRPVFAWMFMGGLIVFGFFAYKKLGISQNPDVDIPVVNISINWEGAAPEIIELDVVDPVESQLSTISGVKSIKSTSRRGVANIAIEFDIKKDIDLAVQEVQSTLLRAQRNLPKDIDPPVITKVNPEDQPIFWISVTAENVTNRDLMVFVRDRIKDRLQSVDGVSDIILGGYVEPNLRVYPKLSTLEKYDLTPLDLINAIQTEQKELPSGTLESSGKELIVRTMGEVHNAEDFKKMSISRRGGSPNYTPIQIGDVANVEQGLADIQRLSRVNGKMSLGLGIRKQRGSNAVEVGNRVKAKVLEIKQSLPPGYDIGINYDGTIFIEESINELTFTTFICSLLTALVVWLFLRTFNSTLNIILSIPTVVFATFLVMKAFGFTLNTFTMMALTLAVGMIVDDNIMVLENINRWYTKTKNWQEAAIHGTSEIYGAVIATSLAVVAIFLPIGYMSGITGLFFYQFAIVLTSTMFFSTLDSLIFTPMRAARLTNDEGIKEVKVSEKFELWQNRYFNLLQKALKKPGKVLSLSFLMVIVICAFSFKLLKTEFLPAQDQSLLMLMVKTPAGSSINYTDGKVREIEKILLNTKQIKRYFVSIGGFQGNESNNGFAYITLMPKNERGPLNGINHPTHLNIADHLRSEINNKVKDVFIIVQDPSSRGFSQGRGQGAELEFKITGPDWEVLTQLVEQYKKMMTDSKLLKDVDSNYKGKVTELRIVPDRQKMMLRGVSVEELAKTVQATVSGTVAAKLSAGGRRFDVRIKLTEEDLKDKSIINSIPIRNNRGQTIRLGDVANISEEPGLLSTTREDRERAVSVFGIRENKKDSLDKVISILKNELQKVLPDGYSLTESGASKDFKSSGFDFLLTFIMGILISYMVLGAQYNSFVSPLIILLALPFSLAGAFLALSLTGISLNLYSAIGMILLAGIVKKNSIMLVEFTNQVREKENLNTFDALLKACPLRLRAIVMTTLTTIAGTLPAALSLGPGAETRIPLAVTVIGGLLLSTILTLVVVPCAYLLVYRKK